MDGNGQEAGPPAMALLSVGGLNTGTVRAPGATRRATGNEVQTVPGASRGVDHQVLIQVTPKSGGGERKLITGEEHLERGRRKGPSQAPTPMMAAATERGEDGGVLTEGVQPETDRGGNETEIERGGRAKTENEKDRETKAQSTGKGVKTAVRETERGSALVHRSHPIAQGLSVGAV